jgi:hypothetical protein
MATAEHAPPATPEYLNWSEHLIGFDRSDHPLKIPRPGHHALVLEAQIGGKKWIGTCHLSDIGNTRWTYAFEL